MQLRPPVAADPNSHRAHEPLSALITRGGPQGWRVPGGGVGGGLRESEVPTLCSSVLIATLEAPFIRRGALCYFQPPRRERWNHQEALNWKK